MDPRCVGVASASAAQQKAFRAYMRVLVDMTETALHGYNTGIQRVVRNVVSRAPALSTSLGVEVVPVAAIGRSWPSRS